MIELRKVLVFIIVSLLFVYLLWLNFKVLNKYGNKKLLAALMITGLGLLSIASFFDMVSNLTGDKFEELVSTCFIAGAIVLVTYIVFWGNYIISILASLSKRAHNDPMTGLYNRFGIEKIFREDICTKDSFYVMILDLDNTKEINDRFGHLIGDQYIINAAEIIKDVVGKKGFVGRTGGDEFIAFLRDIDEDQMKQIKLEINTRASKIFYKYDTEISIGYSKYKRDGSSLEELLKIADFRMYDEKEGRKKIVNNQ